MIRPCRRFWRNARKTEGMLTPLWRKKFLSSETRVALMRWGDTSPSPIHRHAAALIRKDLPEKNAVAVRDAKGEDGSGLEFRLRERKIEGPCDAGGQRQNGEQESSFPLSHFSIVTVCSAPRPKTSGEYISFDLVSRGPERAERQGPGQVAVRVESGRQGICEEQDSVVAHFGMMEAFPPSLVPFVRSVQLPQLFLALREERGIDRFKSGRERIIYDDEESLLGHDDIDRDDDQGTRLDRLEGLPVERLEVLEDRDPFVPGARAFASAHRSCALCNRGSRLHPSGPPAEAPCRRGRRKAPSEPI